VAGQLAQARRRQIELQRRADALALLCRKLEEKRQATLTPPAGAVAGAHAALPAAAGARSDHAHGRRAAPATLTRLNAGGAVESGQLQELSFGARAAAAHSRFAYADLLQEAGARPC
jgi:hypothetical protein